MGLPYRAAVVVTVNDLVGNVVFSKKCNRCKLMKWEKIPCRQQRCEFAQVLRCVVTRLFTTLLGNTMMNSDDLLLHRRHVGHGTVRVV